MQSDVLQKLPGNYRDVIEFCMETGLRPGEVCALLVSHANIRQGSLRVERTFSGSVIRETTKQKRKRTIPLSDRALQIVTRHIEGKLPEAFLFVNPTTGTHYTTNRLTKIWKKYSDIGNVTLYEATRHSFGSQLIDHRYIYSQNTYGSLRYWDYRKIFTWRMSTLRNCKL